MTSMMRKRDADHTRSDIAAAADQAPSENAAVAALRGQPYAVQMAALSPWPGAREDVQAVAADGVRGAGGTLPFAEQIQSSFGRHDVSGVRAHTGGHATDAATTMGAKAYAMNNDVAFAGAPDLHTAAHEAAHVIQQRGGVSLKGGVGQTGDRYERHADAVADLVVSGRSAEGLLDQMSGPSGSAAGVGAVQCKRGGKGDTITGRPVNRVAKRAGLEITVNRGKRHGVTRDHKAFFDGSELGITLLTDDETRVWGAGISVDSVTSRDHVTFKRNGGRRKPSGPMPGKMVMIQSGRGGTKVTVDKGRNDGVRLSQYVNYQGVSYPIDKLTTTETTATIDLATHVVAGDVHVLIGKKIR